MAKKMDPLKAKEAKQKKIAIGGAVLLLALLGVQGPKTLKMLKGPQPVAAPASTSTAPTTAIPAAGTAGGTAVGELPAAAAPELSAVADSDASPEVEEGQLATFERFASKDPFAQQAEPAEAAPAPVSQPKGTTEEQPAAAASDDAAAGDGAATKGDGAEDGGFTTGGSTATAPDLAAATSISVNGVAAEVAVEESFPKDEPTFVLVKIAKNGKSVEIGIAGGEYANGGETMTLGLGEKITLQNTVDGSRYELELLTIQGQPVPKGK